MRDSSDDFFNAFDQNSPGKRVAPPPPRRTAPPGPPRLHSRSQQQQQQNQPTDPQQQQAPPRSYILNNNSTSPSQQASYYYGGAPQPAAPPAPGGRSSSFVVPPVAPLPSSYVSPPPPYIGVPSEPSVRQQPQASTPYGYSNAGGSGFMQPQSMPTQPYGFANQMNPNNNDPPIPAAFQGTMDSEGMMGLSGTYAPSAFTPNPYASKQLEEEEPPLLEELGINVEHILLKTKAVVIPFRRFHTNSALTDPSMIMEDADLAGPLALALLLGGELMMTGKLQFGYIYGFGVFGCMAMTLILNLMSPDKVISFWTVASVLGYALLPVNILAALKIVFWGYFTEVLGVITVIWSTTASTRLLEVGCGMVAQRYLLAYPIALLYSAFVLITIF